MHEAKSFRPLASSLIHKVLVATLIAILATAVVQGVLTYRATERQFAATVAEMGEANARLLSRSVWEIRPDLAQIVLDTLMRNPVVGYAEVTEPSNLAAVAKSGDASLNGNPISRIFDIKDPHHGIRAIGQLKIVMSQTVLYQQIALQVAAVVLPCIATAVFIFLAVSSLLRQHLQRPMETLADFVAELDADHLAQPLVLDRPSMKSRDELDLVLDGFRNLQGRIATHVDTLSEQVADRTAHLQRALDSLKVLSTTDALTGCYNRLHFSERFPQELARAQRYGRPLSTIFCDVDRFKSVNDTHGHAVGDQVLRAVGQRLRESLRSSGDWVVRYGGEEFVLVLPETNLVQASQLAERIRQAVAEQVRVPLAGGAELRATVSFGVAEQQPSDDGESLLKRADHWLFEAKRCGRNQVQPVLEGPG